MSTVSTDLRATAVLAGCPYLIVWTYLGTDALLAGFPHTVMQTNLRSPTVFAVLLHTVVCTNLRASTVFTLCVVAAMCTDGVPTAFFALAALTFVHAQLGSNGSYTEFIVEAIITDRLWLTMPTNNRETTVFTLSSNAIVLTYLRSSALPA